MLAQLGIASLSSATHVSHLLAKSLSDAFARRLKILTFPSQSCTLIASIRELSTFALVPGCGEQALRTFTHQLSRAYYTVTTRPKLLVVVFWSSAGTTEDRHRLRCALAVEVHHKPREVTPWQCADIPCTQ